MNRFAFIACVVMLFALSCTSGPAAESAPSNLIPRDTFVVVLADVRLLEGAYSTSYERVDTSDYAIASYYQRLFEEHHITKEQYLISYDYYSRHMDDLLSIESDVAARLEEMKLPADSLIQ